MNKNSTEINSADYNEPMVSVVIPTYNRCEDCVECIKSIYQSTYSNIEIIVVDNASTDNTREVLTNVYGKNQNFKYIAQTHNMMAAGGRNAGIKYAHGDYLCFIDSDNIIEPHMIEYLVDVMEDDITIGMIGPLMLYYQDKSRIWFTGNELNVFTSRAKSYYAGKRIDEVSLPKIIPTDHLPNLMMVRKSIQSQVGFFDNEYYIMYEETDFAWRVKQLGYKIVVCTNAITYHNCFLPDEKVQNEMRKLGCDNPERTYHFAKNRNIFMKKFAPWYGKITYFIFFRFAFVLYYCVKAIRNGRKDIASAYFKGAFVKYKKIPYN